MSKNSNGTASAWILASAGYEIRKVLHHLLIVFLYYVRLMS